MYQPIRLAMAPAINPPTPPSPIVPIPPAMLERRTTVVACPSAVVSASTSSYTVASSFAARSIRSDKLAMNPPPQSRTPIRSTARHKRAGKSSQRWTHEVAEIVAIEALLDRLAAAFQARLEALDRIAAAFDVRVVGGKQADLLAGLRDDPADRLGWIRRDADLPAHVLTRAQLELAQPFLCFRKRFEGRFHLPHPARQPDAALLDDADLEIRKMIEDAVEDHRRQRLHGRKRNRHVVHRAEVLGAAVEVGHHRQAVLEVVRIDQPAAAADVKHDRHAGVLRGGPDRK